MNQIESFQIKINFGLITGTIPKNHCVNCTLTVGLTTASCLVNSHFRVFSPVQYCRVLYGTGTRMHSGAKATPGGWIGVRTIQNAHQLPPAGPNGVSSRPVRAATHPVPSSRPKFSPENARVKTASVVQDTPRNVKASKNVCQGTVAGQIGQSVQSHVEEA